MCCFCEYIGVKGVRGETHKICIFLGMGGPILIKNWHIALFWNTLNDGRKIKILHFSSVSGYYGIIFFWGGPLVITTATVALQPLNFDYQQTLSYVKLCKIM